MSFSRSPHLGQGDSSPSSIRQFADVAHGGHPGNNYWGKFIVGRYVPHYHLFRRVPPKKHQRPPPDCSHGIKLPQRINAAATHSTLNFGARHNRYFSIHMLAKVRTYKLERVCLLLGSHIVGGGPFEVGLIIGRSCGGVVMVMTHF